MTVERAEALVKGLSYEDIARLEAYIKNIKEQRLNELNDFEFLGTTFKISIFRHQNYCTQAIYTGFLYGQEIVIISDGLNYTRWMSRLYYDHGGVFNTPQQAVISHLKNLIKRSRAEIEDGIEMIGEYSRSNKEHADLIFDFESLLK